MRNRRLIVALLAAVLFGLIAAVSVSRYLASSQAFTRNLRNVVVAKVDIPVGDEIIAEKIAVAQLPADLVPEGTYVQPEDLQGRVATVSISAREPVTEMKLAPEGAAGGLSAIIPEGYRAMTVKVDEVVGVSGFIKPGTLVDVVVVTTPPKEDSAQRDRVSKIVLQNIKVLASGQNLDRPKDEREAEKVRSVTLQVTPEQAEKLALAATEGKLQLVMRNSIDQGDEQTPGANKTTLLSGDVALPLPDPGMTQSAQSSLAASAPRRSSSSAVRRSPRPVISARATRDAAEPRQPAVQTLPPPRPSIEVIEGAKRRSVEFP